MVKRKNSSVTQIDSFGPRYSSLVLLCPLQCVCSACAMRVPVSTHSHQLVRLHSL